MLDYIPKALTRFQYPTPRIPQHQPYPHVKPTYGAKAQYTEDVDSSTPLDKKGKKYVQEVIGMLLYYANCVNNTMLPALGSLATQQANQRKTPKIQSINFSNTPPHILTPSSHIKQVTWYSLATAMHPTYRRPTHKAGQEDMFHVQRRRYS